MTHPPSRDPCPSDTPYTLCLCLLHGEVSIYHECPIPHTRNQAAQDTPHYTSHTQGYQGHGYDRVGGPSALQRSLKSGEELQIGDIQKRLEALQVLLPQLHPNRSRHSLVVGGGWCGVRTWPRGENRGGRVGGIGCECGVVGR